MVALDRQEQAYGLAYMDLATGEFQVTSLSDFDQACGRNSKSPSSGSGRGYCLSEDEQQVLSKQMSLLLSEVEEAMEDVQLLGR